MLARKTDILRPLQFKTLAAIAAMFIAASALAGWVLNLEVLKTVFPDSVSMKVNTALSILFSGLSLLLFISGKNRQGALFFALLVFLTGAVSLSEYLFHWDAGIDELFFNDRLIAQARYPGRMSPITAIAFTLLGISLLTYKFKTIIGLRISEFSTIAVLLIGFAVLIGYLYRSSHLSQLAEITSIAINTAVALLLLGVAILNSKKESGFMAAFNKKTNAARIGIREGTILIAISVLTGWICLKLVNTRFIDTELGISILIMIFTSTFFFVTWSGTKRLNRLELERKNAELTLKESEEKYRSMIEQASDGIFILNDEGRYVDVNPAGCLLIGYSRNELNTLSVNDVLLEGELPMTKLKSKELKSGQTVVMERKCKKKNGNIIDVEASYKMLSNGNTLAIARNITDRKRVQTKENKSFEQQRILAELNRAVSRVKMPEEIYELALNSLQAAIGADKASVLLFDENNIMRFVASLNLSDEYKKAADGHSPWASDEKEAVPILISDPSSEPTLQNFLPVIVREGICSLGFIPLIHQQQLLGKFMVYFTSIHHFTVEEIQIVQNIANNVAFAISEKKSAIALKESEEKHRAIFENSMDGILLTSSDGSVFAANSAACIMFRMTEMEICLAGRQGLVDKDDSNLPILLEERRKTGKVKGELTFLRKDNSRFFAEISSSGFIDATGKEKFSIIIRDITERKEAAQKIIKEKELSDTAINSLPGVFYIFDSDRNLLRWNKNFETVSGYSAVEITQVKTIDFFATEDRDLVKDTVEEVFRKGTAELEAHFLTKSGEKMLYFFTGKTISYEGRKCLLGTGIDITELRRIQQNYSTLVNTVDGIVWEADAQTFQFSFVSQQAERLLGYPLESWTNEPSFWVDHIHPEDRNWAVGYCVSSTQKKKAHEFEYRMIAADGRVVWLRDIVTVIVKDDKPFQLRGIMLDITEQKESVEEMVKSNARFQMVSKATSDIVWDWDIVNHSLWWNDNYYSNLGYTKHKEVVHIDEWYSHIHPDDVSGVRSNAQKIFEGKKSIWGDAYQYQKADGTYLNFLDRGFIIRDKEGKAIRMIGSMVDMTSVYRAQKEVAESEIRFRTIYETEPECIKLLGAKGELLDMNPAGLAMIEADNLEMVKGRPLFGIVAPEYQKAFNRLINDVFKGKSGTLEFEIIGLKGTHRWLETHAVPMRDAAGVINALLGVTRDITQRKKAEQALIESEERYRELVENAPEALVVFDAEKRKFVSVSESAVTLFKYSKDELLKIGPQEISPEYQPDGRLTAEAIIDYIGKAIAGGKPSFEWAHCDKDGKLIPCDVRLVRLPSENKILIRGSMIDITERKRAQEELLKSEQRYSTLVEQAVDAIALYDAAGKILDVNTGSVNLLGYSKKELMKMYLSEILPKEEIKVKPVRYDILQQGESTVKQRKMRRKDGSIVETEVRSQQLPDGRFLSVIRDLSDRKKAEHELNESYKAIRKLTGYLQNIREQERTHIAREIHDELGQQLTVMKMDVSWLNKKVGSSDEVIKDKMKSLLTMLDETVKSVRRISSELRPSLLDDLGLTAAMEWQMTEFEKRSGINCQFISPGKEFKLHESVKTALFRIFQESLTNVARHSVATNLTVNLFEKDNSLCLSIADDGKGFDLKKIADKRTLGILGMKERAAMIDGIYDIKSSTGKGTTVSLTIPFMGE